ncbi:MAG: hypothetical protein VXA08_02935 [Alphaproteobacteria bacterium]
MAPRRAPIDVPDAALGVLSQHATTQQLVYPRFITRPTTFRERRPIAYGTSAQTRVIYDGFKCANCACTPHTAAEALQLLERETAELVDSQRATCGKNAFRPRSVALSLLIHGECCASRNAVKVVDAFASLANIKCDGCRFVHVVRLTIWTGDDADHVARAARPRASVSATRAEPDAIQLCVRWHDATLHEEFLPLDAHTGTSHAYAVSMQNALVRAKVVHGVPLHANISAQLSLVSEDAWAKSHVDASQRFFDRLNYAFPMPEQRKLLKEQLNAECLTDLNAWCRIVRAGFIETNSSTYHGKVYGNAENASEIHQHLEKHAHAPGTMSADKIKRWKLAVALTHADRHSMADCVSLHGLGGRAGAPLRDDGVWVWQLRTMLWPLHLLAKDFGVFVCDEASIWPAAHLEKYVAESLDMAKAHADDFNSNFDDIAPVSAQPPLLLADDDQRAMQICHGIRVTDARQTVGDVRALLDHGGSAAMKALVTQQILLFGVDQTMHDATLKTAEALRSMRTTSSPSVVVRRVEDRCKRLIDAILDKTPPRPPPALRGKANLETLNTVLVALRLKRVHLFDLARAQEREVHILGEALAGCVVEKKLEHVEEACAGALRRASPEAIHRAVNALVHATKVANPVFAIHVKKKNVHIVRHGEGGGIGVNPGSIFDAPDAAIVLFAKRSAFRFERKP